MNARRSIVSWQPVLTDHMAYTLLELGRTADAQVRAVVTSREDVNRRAQGWTVTDLPTLQIEVLPARGWVAFVRGVLSQERTALHIVVSPFGDRRIIAVLALALLLRREVYLVSEPYSPVADGYFDDAGAWSNRLKALLRPSLYRGYGMLIRRRVGGVFAISPLAASQYRRLGVAEARVFPFGYFVPASGDAAASAAPTAAPTGAPQGTLRLVFVGSLIRRKGVDRLVAAVRDLVGRSVPVWLDLYGPGDRRILGPDGEGVRYCGRIPFGETGQTIANYDVLVLPSLHDGWGVVVNEAIQSGVPVACSDGVGAAAVVRHGGCGWVFEGSSVPSIANLLQRLAGDRSLVVAAKRATTVVAGTLAPAVAGRYMHESIQSVRRGVPRPPCPWYP